MFDPERYYQILNTRHVLCEFGHNHEWLTAACDPAGFPECMVMSVLRSMRLSPEWIDMATENSVLMEHAPDCTHAG